jgi:hypothetical protein
MAAIVLVHGIDRSRSLRTSWKANGCQRWLAVSVPRVFPTSPIASGAPLERPEG